MLNAGRQIRRPRGMKNQTRYGGWGFLPELAVQRWIRRPNAWLESSGEPEWSSRVPSAFLCWGWHLPAASLMHPTSCHFPTLGSYFAVDTDDPQYPDLGWAFPRWQWGGVRWGSRLRADPTAPSASQAPLPASHPCQTWQYCLCNSSHPPQLPCGAPRVPLQQSWDPAEGTPVALDLLSHAGSPRLGAVTGLELPCGETETKT